MATSRRTSANKKATSVDASIEVAPEALEAVASPIEEERYISPAVAAAMAGQVIDLGQSIAPID